MKITKEMIDNAILLNKMIELRNIKETTKSKKDKIIYDNYLKIVFEKFSYIVDIHCKKYKRYTNFEDLQQEGSLGLHIALNNFSPVRSKNFFKLAHWYISTRIRRAANKHDVMHMPAKKTGIYTHLNRINEIPDAIDERQDPHERLESSIISKDVKAAISKLPSLEKKIVSLYFGINEKKNNSIYTICNQIKLPRLKVVEALKSACEKLSEKLNYFH